MAHKYKGPQISARRGFAEGVLADPSTRFGSKTKKYKGVTGKAGGIAGGAIGRGVNSLSGGKAGGGLGAAIGRRLGAGGFKKGKFKR